MKENKNILPYAGLTLAMFCWAVSYIWVKEAYESFTPMSLTFSRLVLSTAMLWILGKLLHRITPIKKGTLKYLLLLAFFEPFMYFLGESYGLLYVSPTTGSVIIATIPLFVSFTSFLLYKEKLPLVNFLGALISFVGVIFIIFSNKGKLDGQLIGIALMFMSVLSIVGYSMLINKIATTYSPLSVITYQNTFGLLFFAPLFFIVEYPHFSFSAITENSYIKLFLLSVFASSLAYILFVDGVRQIGVSKANYFINIIPVFTAVFAIYSGFDEWNIFLALGIFLTVFGLFASQFKGSYIRKTMRKLLRKKTNIQTKSIKIEDYNYNLPDERIAKYPLEKRDASKLLVYKNNKISDTLFKELPQQLPENSLLVFNETKVIRARLLFTKSTGAVIEVFCLEPYKPNNYETALQSGGDCEWKCFVGNLKRWKTRIISQEIKIANKICILSAEIVEKQEDSFIIRFTWNETTLSFRDILSHSGNIPIPPYLNRRAEQIDESRYQTIFGKNDGSVAAPTASLHFTQNTLQELENKGIETAKLTLHVGAGTFKPVKTPTIGEHLMHSEYFTFSEEILDTFLENDKIVAVGTTVVRSIESLYYIGVKLLTGQTEPLHIKQWESYAYPQYSKQESLLALKKYMNEKDLESVEAKTDIMIAPGYQFQIISGLITNFHQPQSTLLLLIGAFVGKNWKKIYEYAMMNDFRFLSYGDSSLLIRE